MERFRQHPETEMVQRIDREPFSDISFPPLPYDDSAVYVGRRRILNRIDQEWPCRAQLPDGLCGLPEHDPFTEKCWYHGPGILI
jgi:hypothetical protein